MMASTTQLGDRALSADTAEAPSMATSRLRRRPRVSEM